MSDQAPLPGLPARPETQRRRRGGTASFEERMKHFTADDLEAAAPPLHWPTVSAGVALREWPALIEWVEHLRARYEIFDHKLVPQCWFRHASFVAALQALRDHERVAYSTSAPGTAGVDWHRAMRDVEALMKQWVDGPVSCSDASHVERKTPLEEKEWEEYVANDIAARRRGDVVRLEQRAEYEETRALVDAGVMSSNGTILDDGDDLIEGPRTQRTWRPGPFSPAGSGGAPSGENADTPDDPDAAEED